MQDRARTLQRRNRVYKSLHKPLTYLGVERTLFFFVCVAAVGPLQSLQFSFGRFRASSSAVMPSAPG